MPSEAEDAERRAALAALAAGARQAGLGGPLALALDALAPLDVVASQLALFVRPFVAGMAWDSYSRALAEPGAWRDLRRLLEADEC